MVESVNVHLTICIEHHPNFEVVFLQKAESSMDCRSWASSTVLPEDLPSTRLVGDLCCSIGTTIVHDDHG
jgi:hypothetical protein